MQYSLGYLAKHLNAELHGDASIIILGLAPLDKVTPNEITFLAKGLSAGSKSYKHLLASTKAGAVILTAADVNSSPVPSLIMADPYLGFAQLSALFNNAPLPEQGVVHSSALIGKNCVIPASTSIGAYTVIGDQVTLGENTIIGAHCIVQNDCQIGKNCRLHDRVTLYYACQLGKQVVVHSGTVIGADGFGFANHSGRWVKIYQLGKVIIGNNVDIGANTTIDRGVLQDTVIGNDVIIDNLVQIAHNVHVGNGCAIAGCTGIAGSAKIGNYCLLGGSVAVNGHIEICDQVQIVGSTTIYRSIDKPGIYASPTTAQPFQEWLKCTSVYQKLPKLAKGLQKLERQMAQYVDHSKQLCTSSSWLKKLFKLNK